MIENQDGWTVYDSSWAMAEGALLQRVDEVEGGGEEMVEEEEKEEEGEGCAAFEAVGGVDHHRGGVGGARTKPEEEMEAEGEKGKEEEGEAVPVRIPSPREKAAVAAKTAEEVRDGRVAMAREADAFAGGVQAKSSNVKASGAETAKQSRWKLICLDNGVRIFAVRGLR